VFLPLLLIGLATGAAAIVAYGTHPGLVQYARGLEIIMLTRRLEWPLIVVALIFCVALLALVISNKRRAWWLIGLAPVLALFFHHFAPPAGQRMYVVEFAEAAQQFVPSDDSWVVGIVLDDQTFALPYSALFSMPVVFITDYDKRMMVMWSAYANHATAYRVQHEFKSRDLEVVTSVADTLLIYDRRLGQFIIALTGQTFAGGKPIGLAQAVPTFKTTWAVWRKLHPATKLMRGFESTSAPAGPVLPRIAGKSIDGKPAETRIAMIPTTQPIVMESDPIGKQPVNTVAGQTRLLLLRDSATQRLRAFDRNVKEDLFPTFKSRPSAAIPAIIMVDSDSNSLWTIDGKAVDGRLKGTQMKELPVEDDLYWGVMKYWYPQMMLTK